MLGRFRGSGEAELHNRRTVETLMPSSRAIRPKL
jgi:hypothetical protein